MLKTNEDGLSYLSSQRLFLHPSGHCSH